MFNLNAQQNQFNQPINMNNMNSNVNMNQAMNNMNQFTGWNFNNMSLALCQDEKGCCHNNHKSKFNITLLYKYMSSTKKSRKNRIIMEKRKIF